MRNSTGLPFWKLILCGSMLLLSGVLSAKTLHVALSGAAASNCTSTQPCRQIRRALQLVNAGDTVEIADGHYLGFTMDQISGTASQPITIRATGSNAIILPTTDRSIFENRDTIFLTFSHYIVIDGLKTFNAPRSGMRVNTSHNIFAGNLAVAFND